MKHESVVFEERQQKMLDECINLFGCVPGDYQIESVVTNKVVAIKFAKRTVKQMLENAPHVRNKFHKALCLQLASVSGVAKCNDTDTFNEERGMRLAKLRFIKKVANISLGCYKQIHQDMTRRFEQTRDKIVSSVEKMNTAIAQFDVDYVAKT